MADVELVKAIAEVEKEASAIVQEAQVAADQTIAEARETSDRRIAEATEQAREIRQKHRDESGQIRETELTEARKRASGAAEQRMKQARDRLDDAVEAIIARSVSADVNR